MKQQAAQVYFPLPVYMEIKTVAQKEGKPMATWVREVITKELQKKQTKKWKFSDLPTFKWEDPDPTVSQHVDDFIYKKDW